MKTLNEAKMNAQFELLEARYAEMDEEERQKHKNTVTQTLADIMAKQNVA